MTKDKKFEAWAERELYRNGNTAIIDDGEGGYIVFGKYYMHPVDGKFSVERPDREIHKFATKRTAMSYIVADKNNRLNLANQILKLDTKQQLLAADIKCRQLLCQRAKTQEFCDMVEAKVEPVIAQHTAVSNELEKCVNSAKYIQIRGFNNETARIHG